MQNKNIIITPCSDTKIHNESPAYLMYKSTLMQMINSVGFEQVSAKFEVLFLSARYGLIHSSTIIKKYNEVLNGDDSQLNAFVVKHRGSANKLLNSFANSQVTVYTFLFKNYLKVFRALNLVSLKKFKGVYHSENVRGSGDHRGRLSKVIHTKLYPSTKAPTYFRSGCCNDTEFLGFLTAGEAIGTSLAYISKNKKLFQYSLDAIN